MEKDVPRKEEVWVRIAVAVAGASNSTNKASVITWADYISNQYAERFPKVD